MTIGPTTAGLIGNLMSIDIEFRIRARVNIDGTSPVFYSIKVTMINECILPTISVTAIPLASTTVLTAIDGSGTLIPSTPLSLFAINNHPNPSVNCFISEWRLQSSNV